MPNPRKLQVTTTHAAYDTIRTAAAAHNLSVSGYVRLLLVQHVAALQQAQRLQQGQPSLEEFYRSL